MRWSKIKNMILILLVIVNLSLLALVGARAWQSERNERETREQMVAVLEKSGITFLPDAFPADLDLAPCKVTIDPPGEAEAALLLGEVTATSVVGARTTYVGQGGQADFSESGDIRAVLPAQRSVLISNGESVTVLVPSEDEILDRLSSIGVALREVDTPVADDLHHTYVQLWNSLPVFGRNAEFTEPGGSWEITLRRLAGTEEPIAATGAPLTAPTALARFLEALKAGGYVCSQVTEMYPGYTASGVSTVTLAPCWFIETDAWPWRFAVDAYSGEVTTVN